MIFRAARNFDENWESFAKTLMFITQINILTQKLFS